MLDAIDLSLSLDRDTYRAEMDRLQAQLRELAQQVYARKRPAVIVFEGWPASGVGSCIRRVTRRLDPRGYVVYSKTSLTGEEASYHYLYRFWKRVPARGQIALFDGSWYSRVLRERVKGLCAGEAWNRAYDEINTFERQLADFGTIVVKFWLHISAAEQQRRLEARQAAPKSWPREAYELAISDMLLKTSTLAGPWTIVESDDRRWQRVKVLRSLVSVLARELDYRPQVAPRRKRRKKDTKQP